MESRTLRNSVNHQRHDSKYSRTQASYYPSLRSLLSPDVIAFILVLTTSCLVSPFYPNPIGLSREVSRFLRSVSHDHGCSWTQVRFIDFSFWCWCCLQTLSYSELLFCICLLSRMDLLGFRKHLRTQERIASVTLILKVSTCNHDYGLIPQWADVGY